MSAEEGRHETSTQTRRRKHQKELNAFSRTAAVLSIAALMLTSSVSLAGAQASVRIVDIRGAHPGTEDGKPHFAGSAALDFHPFIATVGTGQDVLFVNKGAIEPHTVTSYTIKVPITIGDLTFFQPIPDGTFDSGTGENELIFPGETFTVSTSSLSPGDYKYFCQLHSWMQGVVRVVSDLTGSSAIVTIDHHLGDAPIESLKMPVNWWATWGFTPTSFSVKRGAEIVFSNNGFFPHTVTSYTDKIGLPFGDLVIMFPVEDGVFDSDFTPPGGAFTLNTGGLNVGTYTYFCEFHPWMQASLKVV